MRISPNFIGKAGLLAAGLAVLAVFLQWIGLPVNWPDPPHTLYSEIARTVL
jgi:hypothetical protein